MSEPNTIVLTLPYPPSANRYWRSVVNKKTGRAMVFVSEEAKVFKRDVAILASRCQPFIGEVIATYKFYRPQRSGDLSNRIKVLEDAMEGTVFLNDSQIVELHAFKFDDKKNPRVEIEVRPVGLI